MDRNDKRSPRVSDQLDHEIQGFVTGAPVPNRDDGKLQEEIGRLEPGRRPLTAERGDGQPSIDDTFRRQEFARWLVPSVFPERGLALADEARSAGAPAWVVDALADAGDRLFETIGEAFDSTVGLRPVHEEDDQ